MVWIVIFCKCEVQILFQIYLSLLIVMECFQIIYGISDGVRRIVVKFAFGFPSNQMYFTYSCNGSLHSCKIVKVLYSHVKGLLHSVLIAFLRHTRLHWLTK